MSVVFKNILQAFRQEFQDRQTPHEAMQVQKRQTRFNYRTGPMYFLGEQIVKMMEDAGKPAFIHCCYRPPNIQNEKYVQGYSKAQAFQSPHQYYEAVDIVHPTLFWNVSDDYWTTLADCAEVIERRFDVQLDGGFRWGWDFAHIELDNWRTVRSSVGQRPPNQAELDARFEEVLPSVWKQHTRSKSFLTRTLLGTSAAE